MKETVTTAVMRRMDEQEIKKGTPAGTLMKRAGQAVVSAYGFNGKTAIICGTGNNAGDGYVIASEIYDGTRECVLFLLEEKFSNDGKFYFDVCKKKNIPIKFFTEETDLSVYDTVVDCIFGTGYRGNPEGKYALAIEKINSSGAYVISVDINSGLNGDNGLGSLFVISDLTVSIGAYKTGHFLGKAKDAIKKLINADIGIPITEKPCYLVEEADFKEIVLPRKNYSHKGTYGTVAIIGGCEKYQGAVKLADSALSALRAGCGISRLIISESVIPYIAPCVKESTIFPIRGKRGEMKFRKREWEKALSNVSTTVIGPGWGRSKNKRKILEYVIKESETPVVIDADALNALSEDIGILRYKKAQIILTPHLGEMSRLTGKSIAEISGNPIETAKEFAAERGVIVLLKGSSTIVTDGEDTYIVNRGCAGMATGGSGDVLSGIIGGVLGESLNRENILLSVAYATFINGFAGELAQKEKTDIAMLSSDTVTKIPDAVIYIRKKQESDCI